MYKYITYTQYTHVLLSSRHRLKAPSWWWSRIAEIPMSQELRRWKKHKNIFATFHRSFWKRTIQSKPPVLPTRHRSGSAPPSIASRHQLSGSNGWHLSIPGGFRGYLRLRSCSSKSQWKVLGLWFSEGGASPLAPAFPATSLSSNFWFLPVPKLTLIGPWTWQDMRALADGNSGGCAWGRDDFSAFLRSEGAASILMLRAHCGLQLQEIWLNYHLCNVVPTCTCDVFRTWTWWNIG
jgi:hypothetical protein